MAYNGIIPPSQWCHDPNIKNSDGKTVEYYLKLRGKTVSNEWKCEEQPIRIKSI